MRPLLTFAFVLSLALAPPSVGAGQRATCASFATQSAAQAAYRADPARYAELDRDRDGVVCEANRCPCDRDPVILTPPESPTEAPSGDDEG